MYTVKIENITESIFGNNNNRTFIHNEDTFSFDDIKLFINKWCRSFNIDVWSNNHSIVKPLHHGVILCDCPYEITVDVTELAYGSFVNKTFKINLTLTKIAQFFEVTCQSRGRLEDKPFNSYEDTVILNSSFFENTERNFGSNVIKAAEMSLITCFDEDSIDKVLNVKLKDWFYSKEITNKKDIVCDWEDNPNLALTINYIKPCTKLKLDLKTQ